MVIYSPSYLLSGNGHVVLDISKHSRLDEVSSVCSYSSSTHQLGSFSLPAADVSQNLVELLLIYLESLLEERASIVCDGAKYSTLRTTDFIYVYLRSLLCLKVKRISYNSFLGSLHTALHKLIVDIGLDIRSRASTATLALVEKQSKVGLLHSVLH